MSDRIVRMCLVAALAAACARGPSRESGTAVAYRQFWHADKPEQTRCAELATAAQDQVVPPDTTPAPRAVALVDDCVVDGIAVPAGTGVIRRDPDMLALYPRRVLRIGSLRCRARSEVTLTAGRLRCDLDAPASIGGIHVARGPVTVDEHQRLDSGILLRDRSFDGYVLAAATLVQFSRPGHHLVYGTLARPYVIANIPVQRGAQVEWFADGRVREITFARPQRIAIGAAAMVAIGVTFRDVPRGRRGPARHPPSDGSIETIVLAERTPDGHPIVIELDEDGFANRRITDPPIDDE